MRLPSSVKDSRFPLNTMMTKIRLDTLKSTSKQYSSRHHLYIESTWEAGIVMGKSVKKLLVKKTDFEAVFFTLPFFLQFWIKMEVFWDFEDLWEQKLRFLPRIWNRQRMEYSGLECRDSISLQQQPEKRCSGQRFIQSTCSHKMTSSCVHVNTIDAFVFVYHDDALNTAQTEFIVTMADRYGPELNSSVGAKCP